MRVAVFGWLMIGILAAFFGGILLLGLSARREIARRAGEHRADG